MNDFLTRLVDEQLELQQRFDELSSFSASGRIGGLEPPHRRLVRMQLSAMSLYNEILKDRILLLTNNK